MTIDPALLAQANFTNMEKREDRTLQFYAIRSNWTWHLTEKTRDPTSCVIKTLGQNVDPITLMGCAPTTPNRPLTVYDRRVEIVDCGRRRKLAGLLLSELKRETEEERELRRMSQADPVEPLMKWLARKKHALDVTRADVATSIKEGHLYKALHHWGDRDLVKLSVAEAQGEHWRRLVAVFDGYENPQPGQFLAELKSTLGDLKTLLANQKDPGNYVQNLYCSTYAVYAKEGVYQLASELAEQISFFGAVERAKTTIANRYSPPHLPADLRL